jgi:hypothetical protein
VAAGRRGSGPGLGQGAGQPVRQPSLSPPGVSQLQLD